MDDEQRYLFDTRGVFTIPGALPFDVVAELNRIFVRHSAYFFLLQFCWSSPASDPF
jgi:hypothetical protein